MKKTVILTLLGLCLSICSYSQIQNKVLGFTLGSTTKSAVLNNLKTNHTKYELGKEPIDITLYKVKFAGQMWDICFLCFYEGVLTDVSLMLSDKEISIETLDIIYQTLSNNLFNKYESYLYKTENDKIDMYYQDGIIDLSLTYHDIRDNHKILSIRYSHIPTIMQKLKSEADEL